jgi:3-oxoacyl-[acyl-carrier-protein] synthase-1
MTLELDIVSIGMVTAVGLDAPSACAAMRARLDGFQETRFLGPGGDWLVGAPVPLPRNFIGEKRLAHMAAAAILEAIDDHPEACGTAALILCLAEEGRPGRPNPDPARLAARIAEITGLISPHRTRIVAHGRPSGHVALDQARRLLADRTCPYVMICGVDSYLTARTIAHYFAERRLLTPDNPNGFLPGEAAAAILCTAARRSGTPAALALSGLGLAREKAFLYNARDVDGLDLPLRGDGMTQAYAIALEEARIALRDVNYRISDVSGEKYFFFQSALAGQRLTRDRSEFQDFWSPAESIGNVGSAFVPVMVAHAVVAARKGYAGGSPVAVEASGDDGACGVAILTALPGKS